MDAAVNDKSRILTVADHSNERIQMFVFEGNFLREIALKGEPRSLAFTESGDLLVSVYIDSLKSLNRRIFLFTENGKFIRYFGGEHVKNPWYVSVSSDGRIITSDSDDQRIKFLQVTGKTYFSHSKPQIAMKPQTVSFITRTSLLLLFVLLVVSWYLTTQGSIYMTWAATDLVTGSSRILKVSLLTS